MEWLDDLTLIDMIQLAPPLQKVESDDNYSIDDVALILMQKKIVTIQPSRQRALLRFKYCKRMTRRKNSLNISSRNSSSDNKVWRAVKKEFNLFLCTNDPKYTELRDKLEKSRKATSSTIVSIIAAAITPILGFEIGALVGLVSVCLYGVIKVGKEAYCSLST